MNAANLINQSSSDVEIYTPDNIIEAARQALGGTICLDPATSDRANRRVRALRWYGIEADGMTQPWEASTVWLNHPFGRKEPPCPADCAKDHVHHDYPLHGNTAWIQKAIAEHASARTKALCMICFASTSEAWFRPLMRFPQCFLSPRTNYLRPDGTVYKGVPKGSVVTYMGSDLPAFVEAFRELGEIKVAYQP